MDPDRHELRWGLILNYRTGQRFIINLSDPILRQLSLNKRVIRVSDDHELDESALLAGVVDDIVRLVHSDGSATEERASDWTPQCRKDLLLEYVRLTQGPTAMAEVSRCLQHASMALTGNARINVNLAKDQLTRLQRLVLDADISHFRLISVGDGPLVRLTSEPLRVGTRR